MPRHLCVNVKFDHLKDGISLYIYMFFCKLSPERKDGRLWLAPVTKLRNQTKVQGLRFPFVQDGRENNKSFRHATCTENVDVLSVESISL